MSDDPRRDSISRAQWAHDLLENEMLKEAFQSLQADYMRLWEHTKPFDTEGREKIFIAWHVVGKVQEHLYRVIDSGKIAQKELDELIEREERKKRFGII